MTADPLADVVTLLQPTARFSKFVECAGTWRIHRKSTGEPFFCAVLEGGCQVSVDGQQSLALRAGDFLLIPAMHDLISESIDAPADLPAMTPTEVSEGCFRVGRADGPPDLRMQVGHCSFNSPDSTMLVKLLPQRVLVSGEPRLTTLIQLVGNETRARRPARELVLERLLEVLLLEAFRSGGAPSSGAGLARGLADTHLGNSLRAIHSRPEYPWTVAELAAEAALSRSAFFARFNRQVGLPPMEYLLAWRMVLAKQLLTEQQLGLQQVAERVGYSSASTFSVAFARHAGIAPARYARMGSEKSGLQGLIASGDG